MFRVLVYGLAILHLGPGIAFAALAFGCDPSQLLGSICRRDSLAVFAVITLVAWVALGLGAALMLSRERRTGRMPSPPRGR